MVWTLALSWRYLFLSSCLFSSSRYGQCWCVEPCWTALSPKNIFLQLYLDSRLYVGVILLSCLMAKLVTQRAPSLHTQIEVSRLPNRMKTFFAYYHFTRLCPNKRLCAWFMLKLTLLICLSHHAVRHAWMWISPRDLQRAGENIVLPPM